MEELLPMAGRSLWRSASSDQNILGHEDPTCRCSWMWTKWCTRTISVSTIIHQLTQYLDHLQTSHGQMTSFSVLFMDKVDVVDCFMHQGKVTDYYIYLLSNPWYCGALPMITRTMRDTYPSATVRWPHFLKHTRCPSTHARWGILWCSA